MPAEAGRNFILFETGVDPQLGEERANGLVIFRANKQARDFPNGENPRAELNPIIQYPKIGYESDGMARFACRGLDMNSLGLLRSAALAGAATLALAASANAADFVNGSFEAGTFAGWTAQRWAIEGGGTDGSFQADTPCSGDPCTDLSDTSGNAELSQLLTGLTDGLSYTVTFDARSNGTTPNALDVYVDGVAKLNLTDFAASYQTYTLGFTASGTTANFAVLGRNDPFVTEVDNFHLTADAGAGGVPEPAAWALMLVGFGAAGGLLRQRRAAGLAKAT